jgi:hypothetical protein
VPRNWCACFYTSLCYANFLYECVMLCIASCRLLCVVLLEWLVLACYVFLLLLWYFILFMCITGANCVYYLVWGSIELMFLCIIDYIMLNFWSPYVSFHPYSPYLCVDWLLSQTPISVVRQWKLTRGIWTTGRLVVLTVKTNIYIYI